MRLDLIYCPRCLTSHAPGEHVQKRTTVTVTPGSATVKIEVQQEGSDVHTVSEPLAGQHKKKPAVMAAESPRQALSFPKGADGKFDRQKYQREYMREYRKRNKSQDQK